MNAYKANLNRKYADGTSEDFEKFFDSIKSAEKWIDYIESGKPYSKPANNVYVINTKEYETVIRITKIAIETR